MIQQSWKMTPFSKNVEQLTESKVEGCNTSIKSDFTKSIHTAKEPGNQALSLQPEMESRQAIKSFHIVQRGKALIRQYCLSSMQVFITTKD